MTNKVKPLALATILIIFSGLLIASPFQVIEETSDYVKVKFTLPVWKLDSVRENNQSWQKLSCDLGNPVSQDGYPYMLSFSEAIGIPIDGDISINLVSKKETVYPDTKLYPCEKMVVNEKDVDYTFFQDLKAYRSNNLYPLNLLDKGKSAFIGNRNMIPITISPFQYKSLNKELVVTTEAEFIISIAGTKTPSRNWSMETNYIDSTGDTFFLNNRTSQVWRKPKETEPYIPRPRTDLSHVSELQLIVNQEGIYKITFQYLRDQMALMEDSLGIEYAWSLNNIDPRHLELRDEHGPVPIHFVGESDGSFDQNDFFEFYGDRHYGDDGYMDDYTQENVYTLSIVNDLGARLAVENGGLTVTNSSQYIIPDAYQHTVHLEQQLIPDKLGRSYNSSTEFYREDLWFWRKITAPNLDVVPFELQYPKDATIRTFSTKVCLFGLTYKTGLLPDEFDHKATIRLNQAYINTKSWRDQTEQIFDNSVPIPNSYLQHGTNYYYISLNGDTAMGSTEQVFLDYIDLTYWREYKTSEDYIKFTKPSDRRFGLYQFKLEGFSSDNISVYKIGSSVMNNLQIEPFSLNGGQPWSVTFQDSVISNDVKYFAVTENNKKLPLAFRVDVPSNLRSPDNAADCIVLTKHEFADCEGTMQYKQTWEQQGYTVSIVDVQDIYDEFNAGIKSADAIKDFIKYAYNNWQEPQLKSLIILGDGTDDERDNSVNRKYNVVPVKKIWTATHGATASDNWYGCVVGDDPIPEISVSRINVWKQEQIIQVAEKSTHYKDNPNFNNLWHNHVILASGGKANESDIFSVQSETVRSTCIPSNYRVSRVYTATQTVNPDFQGLTSKLMDKFNEGAVFLQFMGHGGGRIWADYDLFNLGNVSALTNQNYPIVSSLACYCSAFDTGGASSISEAMVLQPGKGAIATIGFTGLGYLYTDLIFAKALSEGLLLHDYNSLGEALNYSKAKFYVMASSNLFQRQALTQGCAILGDTNIKIIKPNFGIDISTDKDIYDHADTLKVSAVFPENTIAAKTYVLKPTEITNNNPYDLPVVAGQYHYSFPLPGNAIETYQRKVMVGGYSVQGEYYGSKNIAYRRGLITHEQLIPAQPTWNDSVRFSVRITSISDISSLVCKVRTDSTILGIIWLDFPMSKSLSDTTLFVTNAALPPQLTGKEILFKYKVRKSDNTVSESSLNTFVVAGPELVMTNMEFAATNQIRQVKLKVKNIGNTTSPPTHVDLYITPYPASQYLLASQVLNTLAINEERQITFDLDTLYTGNIRFEAKVNMPSEFPEWSQSDLNHVKSITLYLNYCSFNQSGGNMTSLDGNLICNIPSNLVNANQTSLFCINAQSPVTAVDEPDVTDIKLLSGVSSIPYEIKTLDSSLVDSTGVFIGGKKLKLTFNYSPNDLVTQEYEGDNSFKIFRWEAGYNKWVLIGGNISTINDKVVFEVNRQGIYSVLRTTDKIKPSIDVNVQDQEFTVGGYVSGSGIISIILSDANGIDVFNNSIKLFLDGVPVPDDNWVMVNHQGNINRIPIKYQLNLSRGNYTLVIDCQDINGLFTTRDVQFIVNDKFDLTKIANYPNPVLGSTIDPKNSGRTRFTYVLTDDADEVKIKIYTVSGRLVKTFKDLPNSVGYHEFPRTVYAWDCKDEQGFFLANGVYFYKVIAKRGNKVIEKTQKMAIVK